MPPAQVRAIPDAHGQPGPGGGPAAVAGLAGAPLLPT
jgi:hypothetical protein